MVSTDDAHAAAEETRSASRALADATRTIEKSQDTYQVLGALTPVMSALSRSLLQLARYHEEHSVRAATDIDIRPGGSLDDGARIALLAAAELRDAAESIVLAEAQVDRAHQLNSRLVWGAEPAELTSRAAESHLHARISSAVSGLGPSEPLAPEPASSGAPDRRSLAERIAGIGR